MTNTEPEVDEATGSTDSVKKSNSEGPVSLDTELASKEIHPGSVTVPPSIEDEDRWICYRIQEQSDQTKKVPKAPIFGTRYGSKSLFNVNPTSTDHATTFYEAREFVHHSTEKLDSDGVDGVGLVFTKTDDLVGVDLDDCYDAESGEIERWASDIVRQLDSYTEASPSGTGLHILVRGELDQEYQNKHEIGLEVYEDDRYFTFTGHHIESTPNKIHERGNAVRDIQRAVMSQSASSSTATTPTDPSGANGTEDAKLVNPEPAEFGPTEEQIVKTASEADDEFAPLFEGRNLEEYDNDHSRADHALACKLAYWCGGDIEQMDAIFRESGLMRSNEWDDRRGATTYGRYTLKKACQQNQERYEGSW